jgi:hypothetical protein
MEFESSEKSKKPKESHVCVLYDPRDGRIVHGHIFVGNGTGMFGPKGQAERERETREGGQRNHGDISKLKLLHAPGGFRFEPNTKYKVDIKSGGLVEATTFPALKTTPAAKRPTRNTRAAKRK